MNLSDEDTVAMIQENSQCQYFLGMSKFKDQAPFDASKLVVFRKRFIPEAMAEINEAIIAAEREILPLSPSGNMSDDEKQPDNDGTLILDATCTSADVPFPKRIIYAPISMSRYITLSMVFPTAYSPVLNS